SPAAATGWPAFRGLRKKPFPSPFLAFANKQQAIMQPKRPLLPELYAPGYDPEAGPICRARYCTLAKAARIRLNPPLELGAVFERARLVRGPGADLAVVRTAGEIGVGFVVRDPLDRTFDTNLPVQRLPQKAQRGFGVGDQLCRFPALEIGVEDE